MHVYAGTGQENPVPFPGSLPAGWLQEGLATSSAHQFSLPLGLSTD